MLSRRDLLGGGTASVATLGTTMFLSGSQYPSDCSFPAHTFLAPGGDFPRTSVERWADITNVKDYRLPQTAIDKANSRPYGGTVWFPDGIYNCTEPLLLRRNTDILMSSGAAIVATARMEAIFTTNEVSADDKWFRRSIRGGILRPGSLAERGIWVKYFADINIEGVHIDNCEGHYIQLGSRLSPEYSYGAELVRLNLRRHLSTEPSAESSGIYFENSGDSEIVTNKIIGVRYGVRGSVSDSKIGQTHVWNGKSQGPLTAGYYITGFDNTLNSCQVDGPFLVGYNFVEGDRNTMLGCNVNNGRYSEQDAVAYAVRIAPGKSLIAIGNSFKGGPSTRLLGDFAGDLNHLYARGNRVLHALKVIGDTG